MGNETNKNIDPRNARSQQYKEVLADAGTKDVCPMCPPLPYHPKPILHDNGLWIVTENAYPYEHSDHHLLLVPVRHVTELPDLTKEEKLSFFDTVNWTTKNLGIRGGGFAMRYGDSLYSGATMKHLHAHIFMPEINEPDLEGKIKAKPVYFPFG